MSWKSFFTKQKKQDLNEGLEKTKKSFFSKIANTVAGKSKIDEEVLDNLKAFHIEIGEVGKFKKSVQMV